MEVAKKFLSNDSSLSCRAYDRLYSFSCGNWDNPICPPSIVQIIKHTHLFGFRIVQLNMGGDNCLVLSINTS
jgi:hypothetical protein